MDKRGRLLSQEPQEMIESATQLYKKKTPPITIEMLNA